ncbi:MAG TPA: hypothetical protein VMR41_03970 [Patescibacteria group bacterium]|nr:hypothetical protein [Patescibacteria group bacterium]
MRIERNLYIGRQAAEGSKILKQPIHVFFPLPQPETEKSFGISYHALITGDITEQQRLHDLIRDDNEILADEVDLSYRNFGRRLPDFADYFLMGALGGYLALKEVADQKGGQLPKITEAMMRNTIVECVGGEDKFRELEEDYRALSKLSPLEPQIYSRTALPLSDFTKDNSLLVYLGNNQPDRVQLNPTQTMINNTTEYRFNSLPLIDRLKGLQTNGFAFSDHFSSDQIDQLYSLWGITFGWNIDEIASFQRRLLGEISSHPDKRSVWFSSIQKDDKIVGAAMAELLTIPTLTSELDLVESTEWRTLEGYGGNGVMTATVALLNAQVLKERASTDLPLIYAECNYSSRSDLAANGAYFTVPSRSATDSPQILRQHVGVNDGYEGRLRDFVIMHLPKEAINYAYNPFQVNKMLDLLS